MVSLPLIKTQRQEIVALTPALSQRERGSWTNLLPEKLAAG